MTRVKTVLSLIATHLHEEKVQQLHGSLWHAVALDWQETTVMEAEVVVLKGLLRDTTSILTPDYYSKGHELL